VASKCLLSSRVQMLYVIGTVGIYWDKFRLGCAGRQQQCIFKNKWLVEVEMS